MTAEALAGAIASWLPSAYLVDETWRAGKPGMVGAEPAGQLLKNGETMVTTSRAERGVSKGCGKGV